MLRSKIIFIGLGLNCFSLLQLGAQQQPNIVFIIADDLGGGDLSCFGQEKFETPNIDRLALTVMRCTHTYAGTTVSAPSRACLMTGLRTSHAPFRGNREMEPERQFPLPKDSYTLFHLFKDAGYKTEAFGKWGHRYPGSEGDPNRQGVDEFFGYNCQWLAHNYYPDHLWHNQTRISSPENYDGSPIFFDSNGMYRGYKHDLTKVASGRPPLFSGKIIYRLERNRFYFCLLGLPAYLRRTVWPKNSCKNGWNQRFTNISMTKGQKTHDFFYFEFYELNGRQAVIHGNWKLLHLNLQKELLYELYNIASYPSEVHNVISLYPVKAEELKKIMQDAHSTDPNWPLFNNEE